MAKAKRAPAGSSKVFTRVANFIRRNGPEDAARYLNTSEKRAKQILNAVDRGKPLGSIVTTTRGLDKWKSKVATAPQLQKNRTTWEAVRDQQISVDRIVAQTGLSRNEVNLFLRDAQYSLGVPGRSKEIRAAIDELKAILPYYSDRGFIVCPEGEDQARQIEGAENGRIFRTGFRDLADIDRYLDVVFGSAREFFMVIQHAPNAQGKVRYSAFDIRPAGMRDMPANFRGLSGFNQIEA